MDSSGSTSIGICTAELRLYPVAEARNEHETSIHAAFVTILSIYIVDGLDVYTATI